MPSAVPLPQDKYFLRSLHQEIGLFDRKIAHLLKHETFANDAARDVAVNKLISKRDQMAITARQLAADGVEFKPAELPPSLRPDDFSLPPEPLEHQEKVVETAETPIPIVGDKAYDLGKEIRAYLEQRKKSATTV